LPPLSTPAGEPVNAVYGFTHALLKAIKDEAPDYVVACFDIGRTTFRNEIYDGYKAHRQETDETPTTGGTHVARLSVLQTDCRW